MSVDYNALTGKIVTFSLYAPAVLGTGYSKVRVIGFVGADVAISYADIITQHAQVYGSLPGGTVDNYAAYDYMLIRNENGNVIPIGVPWINGTITEEVSSMVTVQIPNLDAVKIKELQFVLQANGFEDFTVDVNQV